MIRNVNRNVAAQHNEVTALCHSYRDMNPLDMYSIPMLHKYICKPRFI